MTEAETGINCWQQTFLQHTDDTHICRCHRPTNHRDISTKCQVTFTLHVSDLTFTSGGERDGGGVTGEKPAKPVTAVSDSVSTFVSKKQLEMINFVNMTPLDTFKQTS